MPKEIQAAERKAHTVFVIHLSWRGKDWELTMTRSDQPALQDAILPEARLRWKFFSAGVLLQAFLLLGAICLPVLFPDRIRDLRNYVATVVSPSPEVVRASKPEPLRKRPAVVRPATEAQPQVRPATMPLVVSAPTLKPVKAPVPAEAPSVPAQSTSLLLPGVPAPPSLAKPAEPIKTGMFGDGVLGIRMTTPAGDSPQASSFDSPGVSGHSSPGTFGAARGVVRQGLFADEGIPRSAHKPQASPEAMQQGRPVEILFKPTPQYTSEALAKKVEGYALVEVQFSASGQITVLRVVRGLGYGLDEAAEAAARQIRFKPAQDSEGLAIDSRAIVRMDFALAY